MCFISKATNVFFSFCKTKTCSIFLLFWAVLWHSSVRCVSIDFLQCIASYTLPYEILFDEIVFHKTSYHFVIPSSQLFIYQDFVYFTWTFLNNWNLTTSRDASLKSYFDILPIVTLSMVLVVTIFMHCCYLFIFLHFSFCGYPNS
jgi:hypothetical protein